MHRVQHRPKEHRRKGPPSPLARKIVVGGEQWTYRIDGWGIRFRSPEGKPFFVNMSRFTGWSWPDLERAEWKKYTPPVTPKDIREYIENTLMKMDEDESEQLYAALEEMRA